MSMGIIMRCLLWGAWWHLRYRSSLWMCQTSFLCMTCKARLHVSSILPHLCRKLSQLAREGMITPRQSCLTGWDQHSWRHLPQDAQLGWVVILLKHGNWCQSHAQVVSRMFKPVHRRQKWDCISSHLHVAAMAMNIVRTPSLDGYTSLPHASSALLENPLLVVMIGLSPNLTWQISIPTQIATEIDRQFNSTSSSILATAFLPSPPLPLPIPTHRGYISVYH